MGKLTRWVTAVGIVKRSLDWFGRSGDAATVAKWAAGVVSALGGWLMGLSIGWIALMTVGAIVVIAIWIPVVIEERKERNLLAARQKRRLPRKESPTQPTVHHNAPRGFHAAKYERIALEHHRDDVVKQVADKVLEEVRQRLKEDDG